MIELLLITIVLVGLAIAGIAIKMFVRKGGQFSKSCSSAETTSGNKIGCVCDGEDPQTCDNFDKHHPDSLDA